jgi:large subunit ribosomal protein L5
LSPLQFDGQGNYTFGLTEQVMFHEIDQDKIDKIRGMDITFVTSASTDDEGRALLTGLGFPFQAMDVAQSNRAATKKKRGSGPIGKKKR